MHVTNENFQPFLSALLRGLTTFEDDNLTVTWAKLNENLADKLERINLTNEERNENFQ
jgi:hypothetical protein